jgi:Glycosyl hydrolase 109, C-terminal domain/Oxidoreductase family, NAD-binding Rossmann fold
MKRRKFIRNSALGGAAIGMVGSQAISASIHSSIPEVEASFTSGSAIKMGLIGVGLRGRNHLNLLLQRPDVDVAAICDIDPRAIEASQKMFSKQGAKAPTVYDKNENIFRDMLNTEKLDGVIISTPWEWHVPMAVATMESGAYAGIEVSAATTLEECWNLVNASESTGKPCMILENVCYRRDVMAIMNMVRENVFGELTHMECGYQHDLRFVKFNDGKEPYGKGVEFGEKGYSESKWRTNHSVTRNGDIYPTHGIGPVAKMLGIERGNRFQYLTSMATKSRGLHKYIVDNGGADHPNAKVQFKLGDIITTLIKTHNGETITLQHDTNSPRPYSLGFRVQGTEGIWMDLNKSIYIEGKSEKAHRWEEAQTWLDKYDHPLWKKYGSEAEGAGHGGMDFFVVRAFVESIKNKTQTPLDVYDAATWSSITPLSEMSIQQNGAPMKFPDFTKGKWKNRKEVFALDDNY